MLYVRGLTGGSLANAPAPLTQLEPEVCLLKLRGQERSGSHGAGGEATRARRTPTDDRIVRQLEGLSDADDDYWTFRRGAARRRAHGLTQYPAMMVPAMQAVLLGVVAKADGHVRSVLDPFAGSGTTLVECMRLGLDYAGQDINPLAVLLCRTKAGPFHIARLRSAVQAVARRASSDRERSVEADFPGLEKWFSSKVASDLSRIRRAIRRDDHVWCRRVLWTALAETVRLTSNSRTSTFKLHIRSSDDLGSRTMDPLETFLDLLRDITDRLHTEAVALKEAGHLSANGWYRGDVLLGLGDSAKSAPQVADGCDLLVTSPPYGDNTSTVPYGQYSYLPLQWIDLHDIDESADRSYLRSTYEIDTRSLGGSRKHAVRDIQHLLLVSPSLKTTLRRLVDLPVDRAGRVAAFYRDLDASLQLTLDTLRTNAYMIWTIGNRRVGGKPVPTDAILAELLAARGVHLVTRLERQIPNKRMAPRNAIASTIRSETILVLRKT